LRQSRCQETLHVKRTRSRGLKPQLFSQTWTRCIALLGELLHWPFLKVRRWFVHCSLCVASPIPA
jgi:hypothetical protein